MNKTNKFEIYVSEFANLHRLFQIDENYLVSISGGIDSMVLGHLMLKILGPSFEVIHFNHGTRIENAEEEKLVRKFCLKNNLVFHSIKLNLSLTDSNFEMLARSLRQSHYRQFIDRGYKVLLAHHLDDSFEWSLMQKFKQGNLHQTLGIPLCGAGLIRPLMCVSKEQIRQYAKACNIKWLEDSSNQNTDHERNYLRNVIIEKIRIRYPQYLKHYVYQANQQAFDLFCHRQSILKQESPLKITKHFVEGYVLESTYLELYRDEIVRHIVLLSDKNRGKLNIVIDQIFKTIAKMRANPKYLKFHGPFSFAGKVVIYLLGNKLLITTKNAINLFESYDQNLLTSLREKTHIPFGFINNAESKYFPNLFIQINGTKIMKPSKLELVFFKKSCQYLKQTDIPYSFVQA